MPAQRFFKGPVGFVVWMAAAVVLLLPAAMLVYRATTSDELTKAEIMAQWSGNFSDVQTPAAVSGDEKDWEQVWKLNREAEPEWPEQAEYFAAFYAGSRPTGGYRAETVIEYQDNSVVRVACWVHPPEGPAIMVITYPWVTAVLSGLGERRLELVDCVP